MNCNGCSGVRINELKSIELSEYDHNSTQVHLNGDEVTF